MVFIDPRLGEPAPQLGAGTTAEGLTSRQLDGARCLTNDRDAVAHGSGDDGTGPLEDTCVDAFRAGADPSMKSLQSSITVRSTRQ